MRWLLTASHRCTLCCTSLHPSDQPGHHVARVFHLVSVDVPVDPQGNQRRGMPDHPAHHLRLHAPAQGERNKRDPQVVRADRRHLGPLQGLLPGAVNVVVEQHAAVLGAEQPTFVVPVPERRQVGAALDLGLNGGAGIWREREDPVSGGCFGLAGGRA